MERGSHLVDFYDADDDLVRRAGGWLAGGLLAGQAAVVVATPAHRSGIEAAVHDVTGALAPLDVTFLDAEETLGRIATASGGLDRAAFEATVGAPLRELTAGGRRARVYGELVQLLCERGQAAAALELESLWDEFLRQLPFSLYCGYRADSLAGDRELQRSVCRHHDEVVAERPDRSQTTELPADPRSVRQARQYVTQVLEEWGAGGCSYEAGLVVSELCTNVVQHVGTPLTLTMERFPSKVRISVGDPSQELPQRRQGDWMAVSGRGLDIVAELSAYWGYEHHPGGKGVWAEFPA